MPLYIDLNARYGIDSNKLLITDHAAVQQSMRSLFTYTNKSRFMRPNFASTFWSLLYRVIHTDTAFDIVQAMQTMLAEREPRVIMNIADSVIIADRANKRYIVTLAYALVENGSEGTFTTTLQGAG